jgi:small-conductance mechanosensitive channel
MQHERTLINLLREIHPYRISGLAFIALYDNVEIILIAAAIVVAGFFVSWIGSKLILFCGLPDRARSKFRVTHDKNGNKRVEGHDGDGRISWKPLANDINNNNINHHTKPLFYSARASVVHFTAQCFRYGVIILGFYIAFGAAGVSIFQLAYSLGIVGIIGAYAFGMTLTNISGIFTITASGRWVEGMVISVAGVKGEIMEILSDGVTLKSIDEQTKQYIIVNIPGKYFNEVPVNRYPEEEQGMKDFKVANIETLIRNKPKLIGVTLRKRTKNNLDYVV